MEVDPVSYIAKFESWHGLYWNKTGSTQIQQLLLRLCICCDKIFIYGRRPYFQPKHGRVVFHPIYAKLEWCQLQIAYIRLG